MDTSLKYIEMCKEATEIQSIRNNRYFVGDIVAFPNSLNKKLHLKN